MYRTGLPEFAKEISRARRYRRTLSVLVVKLEHVIQVLPGGPAVTGLDEVQDVKTALVRLAYMLRDNVREIDITAYDLTHDQFVLMLPETNRVQALETHRRLEDVILRQTGARVRCGVAEFQSDGLIVEDLVQSAMLACNGKLAAEMDRQAQLGKDIFTTGISAENS